MSLLLLSACIFISNQELEAKYDQLPDVLRVQSLYPDYAQVGSRPEVTLRGGDFDDTTRVLLGDVEAAVVSFGTVQLTARFDGTTAVPGPQDLEIFRDFDHSQLLLPGAFTFFADRTDQVGLVGWIQRYPDAPTDARLLFPLDWTGTAAEQLGPSQDCAVAYEAPAEGEYQIFEEGSLLLDSAFSSSPLVLTGTGDFQGQTSAAVLGEYGLVATDIPSFPNLQQEDLFSVPEFVHVQAPEAGAPVEAKDFRLLWVPSGGSDEVLVRLEIGEERITCRTEDDGFFLIRSELLPAAEQLPVQVRLQIGRLRERRILLPWDESTASTAAVSWTVAESFEVR
jgi:hypothetical protein